MNEDKPQIPAGWLDWNTLSLDQMVSHLEQEFKYSSTGTAKCIHHLVEFYHQNKKYNLRDRIEEALAKYWYDMEYCHIDKNDHEAGEKSRQAFNKWADENLDSFTK